ncbi:AIPR family protein [Enterobacter mori]|uniref:AIPR family protein n=1 Tax=Enterobacter mori TaxID=539813 RepID=UPI0011DE555B|nr:AIPR family protein [Enterobacter mori]
MKYNILISILDKLRSEAPDNLKKKYALQEEDEDKINAARSRAFIHLFLKVSFGLIRFEDREWYITDGSYDGGIDGYYIDHDLKIIYLIQSKFRTTERNFESKNIELEEILVMDIDNILTDGAETDEKGNLYNGKIKQLQREVKEISDIARYAYKVIILANLNNVTVSQLRRLTCGISPLVFDYKKTYSDLVFPVISGTYFTASDICIPIDLSNKSAGSKISYTVKTKASDCEITVLFVPTLEIAKVMSKYKNSILKYNPRSYLEFEGQAVNSAIRKTICDNETNEFALYNNGITILSDETYINERIGQKNKAQLSIKNPQIINGGQTSYILSRIYEETKEDLVGKVFHEKEVLLKIITLIDNDSVDNKLKLIDEISNATNKQTPVINADKFANETFHQKLQERVFQRFGLLYERKRGEFADGLNNNYVTSEQLIERNLFLRIYYSANGMIEVGAQKKLFQKNDTSKIKLDDDSLDNFYYGFIAFNCLVVQTSRNKRLVHLNKYDKLLSLKVYLYVYLFKGKSENIAGNILYLEREWGKFLEVTKVNNNNKFNYTYKDRLTGEMVSIFKFEKYIKSSKFERDARLYFEQLITSSSQ